ncbi:T9SS type A sorting domain-containing protein [Flavobacterium sp.]|uniref:T9SS type A sorting domain-containing protein n=1 Tax=Flavobacterium sp. TaxID=239 RepID=UPI0039E33BCF
MKKKLRYLLLIILTWSFADAQDFWTETTPFPNNPDYYVKSISIVDANTVWVLGVNNTNNWKRYAFSLDGGLTWADGPISTGGASASHVGSNIHAISANKAYLAIYADTPTVQGGVWVTENSGATWTKQSSALYNTGTDSNVGFLHFFNANDGVVVGDVAGGYFEIYTTSNAGTNWIRVPSSNIQPPADGEYIYEARHYDAKLDAVWFGTNKGNIYQSFDNGYTWGKFQSPYPDFGGASESAHFAFRNPFDGLMVSNTWELWRSGNGGGFWNNETDFYNGLLRNYNLVFVPQTTNTYFGWGMDILENNTGASYSVNGGMDWNEIISEVSPSITAKFYSAQVGYCTGYYNVNPGQLKFFRLTDPLDRLLQNDSFATSPSLVVLPNPTSGLIRLTGANIESVMVCDLSGKVVLKQNYNAVHEAVLDLSALHNGMYLAKVSTGDGATSIAKIIKK